MSWRKQMVDAFMWVWDSIHWIIQDLIEGYYPLIKMGPEGKTVMTFFGLG